MKLAGIACLLTLCFAAGVSSEVITYGKAQQHDKIKGATVRSYTIKDGGRVTAVGLEFSKAMVDSPMTMKCMQVTPTECASMFTAGLPGTAQSSVKWADFALMHQGHAPKGVYSVPHWDIHFHFQPQSVWASKWGKTAFGPCAGLSVAASAKANMPMSPECFPSTRANLNAIVPFQGNHLFDLTAPELNGKPWDKPAFIWGMYEGRLVWMEPMVSIAYMKDLKAGTRNCWDVDMPAKFPAGGWYPTKMCVSKSAAGNVRVGLTTYKRFPAGCTSPRTAGYMLNPTQNAIKGCPVPLPKTN